MSVNLPYVDRVAAFYDLAQTTTAENHEWHVYSITGGRPEKTLEYFPELKLPAVVFCMEKMVFSNNPPIDCMFSVLICVDACDAGAAQKLTQYRKKVGEMLLTQAVLNPALELDHAETFELDPAILTERICFSLKGH